MRWNRCLKAGDVVFWAALWCLMIQRGHGHEHEQTWCIYSVLARLLCAPFQKHVDHFLIASLETIPRQDPSNHFALLRDSQRTDFAAHIPAPPGHCSWCYASSVQSCGSAPHREQVLMPVIGAASPVHRHTIDEDVCDFRPSPRDSKW